jgi:ribosomal-protein-alanine N-acetyltransferase
VATVRRLRSDDLLRVSQIEHAVFSDPWTRRAFGDALLMPHVGAFAAEGEEGTLIGYGLCSAAADQGEILNLAVDPAARRRGTGRLLLDAMVAWLEDRGVSRVYLEVRPSNAAAVELYRRAGFRPAGKRRGYYRAPPEDALTMALEVGVSGQEKDTKPHEFG